LSTNVTIKYCIFANNTAMNGDGNDVYVDFATDFYSNSDNINNDCTYSLSPQLLVNTVFLIFLFSFFLFFSFFFYAIYACNSMLFFFFFFIFKGRLQFTL
jgi:hypothetical protein